MSKKPKYAILFFDGACLPRNPGGTASYGAVLVEYPSKKIISKIKGVSGSGNGMTNNVAEYTALLEGLKVAIENECTNILIRGDSQLVIRQLQGEYAVNSPKLKPLFDDAKLLLQAFNNAVFEWIPREKNTVADELSNQAYTEATGKPAVLEIPKVKAKGNK